MKQKMNDDLLENRKEEYTSPVGLALLFARSGGHLNARMRDVISRWKINTPQAKLMSGQLSEYWNQLNRNDNTCDIEDSSLEFETFFSGFMKPFFRSLSCDESRKALKAIDMDNDGKIAWKEFMVYVKWTLNQYPDITQKDELLSVAFNQGVMPAMVDELLTPLDENRSLLFTITN